MWLELLSFWWYAWVKFWVRNGDGGNDNFFRQCSVCFLFNTRLIKKSLEQVCKFSEVALKKIDFHIHTVSTVCDREFTFSIDTLKSYVKDAELDAIAITNHNLFDKEQFLKIRNELEIKVFPGIEIDVEGTHLLLISDDDELVDFKLKCDVVHENIPDDTSDITVEKLEEIFSDLTKYLLIPHYKKNPQISDSTISKFNDLITAGEVSGPKKFIHTLKEESSLVPLYFSDMRAEEGLKISPSRQTYVDVGEMNISSLKLALKDKQKVFLTSDDGHKFFNVLNNRLTLSTGLNIMLGERSTGKSFTLDAIADEHNNEDTKVKYIKQFSLLQKDVDDEREFSQRLKTSQASITETYLKEFSIVVEHMKNVDKERSERKLEHFVESLLRNAAESHKHDSFANSRLFSESVFGLNNLESLKKLISATVLLIDNSEFEEIISKHVTKESLKALVVELIQKYNSLKEIELKKSYVNDIVEDVKNDLKLNTAATPIAEIDLYDLMFEIKKIEKFNELFESIKLEREFKRQEIQGFSKVAKRYPFQYAREIGAVLGRQISFSDAFSKYNTDGYSYLKELRKIEALEETNYYKLFAKISYEILNSSGSPVSGGERSEYRLLQEINDANDYDILLIDEPESSFDNIFLYNKVNKLIKEISSFMPVVLVTHNSTVGASIQPDYIVYTSKVMIDAKPVYKIFSGHPGDKVLRTSNGEETENHRVLLDCLEAGSEPYNERGKRYAVLKD
ncbi:PHP domain-containing protein [Halobacteriovorax sp. RZ-1]|uniref:PHP domain-containing protein n=1 Tax=unclassified Halobacteriovorax TaxID=2639665 RepID=UPI00371D7550